MEEEGDEIENPSTGKSVKTVPAIGPSGFLRESQKKKKKLTTR